MAKILIMLTTMVLILAASIGVIGVIGIYSLSAEAYEITGGSGELDIGSVNEASDRFLSGYCAVIEDIVSFQEDPSLERAEARKEMAINYAQALMGRFQEAANNLQEGSVESLLPADGQ